MSKHERRNSLALDQSFEYCVRLQTNCEQPELHRLCNAIATLDLALTGQQDSPIPMNLSTEAWSRIRDGLYNILLRSFHGYFEIFDQEGRQIDSAAQFPQEGTISFIPLQINRRNDSYHSPLSRLDLSVITAIRWCFADNKQEIEPAVFQDTISAGEVDNEDEARELLENMYEICQQQAQEGKKKAHRRWWQLYWQVDSCQGKQQRHELAKQMVALEGVWGKPDKS